MSETKRELVLSSDWRTTSLVNSEW